MFVSRFGGDDGKIVGLPALPMEFGSDRRRPGLRHQPPRIGEHNVEVLGEAGFTSEEIAELTEAAIIEGPGTSG